MKTEANKPDGVMDALRKKMLRETLKYAAGKYMFCPACEQVMDWKTTVIITPIQGGKKYTPVTLCKKCFEANAVKALHELEKKGITMEIEQWK